MSEKNTPSGQGKVLPQTPKVTPEIAEKTKLSYDSKINTGSLVVNTLLFLLAMIFGIFGIYQSFLAINAAKFANDTSVKALAVAENARLDNINLEARSAVAEAVTTINQLDGSVKVYNRADFRNAIPDANGKSSGTPNAVSRPFSGQHDKELVVYIEFTGSTLAKNAVKLQGALQVISMFVGDIAGVNLGRDNKVTAADVEVFLCHPLQRMELNLSEVNGNVFRDIKASECGGHLRYMYVYSGRDFDGYEWRCFQMVFGLTNFGLAQLPNDMIDKYNDWKSKAENTYDSQGKISIN